MCTSSPCSRALDLLVSEPRTMAAPASQGGGEDPGGQAGSYPGQPLTPAMTFLGWENKQAVDSVGQGQEGSNLAAHWSRLHPLLEDSTLVLLGSKLGGLKSLSKLPMRLFAARPQTTGLGG